MEVKYIVVHCSATRADREYSVEQLTRDHKNRGFKQPGYHYYIRKNGNVVPLRNERTPGAHAKGFNSVSIGVCYEGGLNSTGKAADTRTDAQKASLRELLTTLRKRYPKAVILGHRDLSPDKNGNGKIEPFEWMKMCPCFEAKTEYKDI